jgi:predicted cupin superfamily sugar epimerase
MDRLVTDLGLAPHPEGGFFRETYRSSADLRDDAARLGYAGPRAASTAIYFLLPGSSFSAFHRIRSDEAWHFYEGAPVEIPVIHPDNRCETLRLGPPDHGGTYQAVVPAHAWFAARCTDPDGYSLVGCTVAPGFDFADFELAARSDLADRYPDHRDLIHAFTRDT